MLRVPLLAAPSSYNAVQDCLGRPSSVDLGLTRARCANARGAGSVVGLGAGADLVESGEFVIRYHP